MKIQINDQLWNAIVSILQDTPSKISRLVLNGLENKQLCQILPEESPVPGADKTVDPKPPIEKEIESEIEKETPIKNTLEEAPPAS